MNDKNSIYRDTVLKFYWLITISYVRDHVFVQRFINNLIIGRRVFEQDGSFLPGNQKTIASRAEACKKM